MSRRSSTSTARPRRSNAARAPLAPRALRKQLTRERVLDKAAQLCARAGFAELRTAEVAKAAGVSHGAVFVHFPSRDDLLLAVAARFGQAITDSMHSLLASRATVREILRAHLSGLAEYEEPYRRLLIEVPHLPPGARASWIGLQSAISSHIGLAAEREIAAGTIRPMPAHLLFNTWVGLVHHYLANREQFAPGRSVLAEHGERLIDHYMHLISAT